MPFHRIITVVLCVLISSCIFNDSKWAAENPDPNHTHADFGVIIRGEQVDFSLNKYMSGASYDEESHDEVGEYLHKYLHLHDNVSHVVHRHKPGHTIGEFFTSLGHPMGDFCFMELCDTEDEKWIMILNSSETDEPYWERMPLFPDYVFEDNDQILFTYGVSNEQIRDYILNMTEDSCLYSRTCPQRGDPPEENCIADPTVPCVAPLDDDF